MNKTPSTPHIQQPKQHPTTNMVCVSFKKNNTFLTVSKFIIYFDFYTFHKLLISYSCGSQNFKNSKKNSLQAYNAASTRLIFFLLKTKNTKIHIIFKGHKKFKNSLLTILLTTTYRYETIKLLSLNNEISYQYNGCRLKKQRFL